MSTITERISKGSKSDKDWWNLVGALHDNAVDSSDHPLLVEGKWTKDFEEKANLLDAHFATISSMPDPDAAMPEEESYREDLPVLSDVEVTTEKLKRAIRRAKTRSASGPDDILC